MLRRTAVALSLLAAAIPATAPAGPNPAIVRPETDIARDAIRHPFELMKFAGIRPGMTVVDFWPAGGYWTRLFAAAVGPKGKVYSFVPAESVRSGPKNPLDVARRFAAEPGLGNVVVMSAPVDSRPRGHDFADVFWIFQNYHDLHNHEVHGADVAAFDRAVYRMLKPGGVFIVADHAAAPGSGFSHAEDQHRADPAAVRAEVTAAGFVFDSQSTILASAADPHTTPIFDSSVRGRTDQFVYRFRKPRH